MVKAVTRSSLISIFHGAGDSMEVHESRGPFLGGERRKSESTMPKSMVSKTKKYVLKVSSYRTHY